MSADPNLSESTRSSLAVAIVMPANDEAEALPHVIGDIPRERVSRIVVVDNNSSDGTADVARRLGVEVISENRPGYGSACQAGIRHLAASPPDVLVILDADYSDYPQDLGKLLEAIESGADLVCGSRVELARPGALGPHVRWGNGLATGLIRLLFGHQFRDMGPFRAIRWDALQKLEMRDPAYGWNAEMQVKALQHGLRTEEVAVRYRDRIGRSKISGTVRGTIGAGTGILLMIATLKFAPRWYARRVSLAT
ncbi:MAG: glycosyltransferase [Acidobacteria bacterium]|nr:glycosyltransferase [Acidobacteriota bacterium]